MQPQELIRLLQQPEDLQANHLDALKSLVVHYPFFQPAHALYLKTLKNKDSYKYNNALKTTAAYTTDRSVLFDFITSEVFNQNSISEQIKQNSEYIKSIEVSAVEDISVNKSVTIDDTLKAQIEATDGVLDPNLFEEKQDTQTPTEQKVTPSVETKAITPEEQLNIGKPLEFDASETHSFTEWLKITRFKPISRTFETDDITEADTESSTQPLIKKLETIDRFISENPKITPSQKAPKPKLVSDTKVEDSLMTETLARIYLEQKNYEKAIQSYRILSLKYPEKSSFFAHQIKAVEELKNRSND